MHGVLLVDKPPGPTSHDVVAFARRLLRTPRIGHTGTLDPLATGLLVLLIGHATRLARFLTGDEKEYIADIRLGIATPTYDAQSLGEAEARGGRREVRCTPEQIRSVLADFRGTFLQSPPPFSAKKVEGVPAYRMARKNEHVHLSRVEVTVHELDVLDAPDASDLARGSSPRTRRPSHLASRPSNLLRLRIVCSAGFYVRSLAHDLGEALGCGAHLEALRRTRAGRFRVEDAATLDVLERLGPAASEWLISINALLADLPAIGLTEEGLKRAANGNALAPHHLSGRVPEIGASARVRVLGSDGEVLTVAEWRADGLLHPLLVLR